MLEDELNQSKTMLTEARQLVEVLTEMLEEKENDGDDDTITPTEEETDLNANSEGASD